MYVFVPSKGCIQVHFHLTAIDTVFYPKKKKSKKKLDWKKYCNLPPLSLTRFRKVIKTKSDQATLKLHVSEIENQISANKNLNIIFADQILKLLYIYNDKLFKPAFLKSFLIVKAYNNTKTIVKFPGN